MMKKYKFRLVGIIGLLGLCSFSNAGTLRVDLPTTYYGNVDLTSSYYWYYPLFTGTVDGSSTYTICAYNFVDYSNLELTFSRINSNNQFIVSNNTDITSANGCYNLRGRYYEDTRIYFGVRSKGKGVVNGIIFNHGEYLTISGSFIQDNSSCPEVNTGDILSGSCDTNYCVENDLCPVPSNFSTLFINDIEHQSAPVINVTIPREYSRDSSVDSGQFDLVISGYNVDYEYIDGIVRTQNAKPNQTDFNNIVSGLIPLFVPGLVIILFIRFVFKFIKKIL